MNTGLAERKTILVIDDAPDSLALISGLLRDDYRVKVANSGERGMEVARREPQPDLILLDVMMPGMDGYQVCAALKADALTTGIPVLFLTAKAEVEDEAHGFATGAEDYISKPVNPAILKARVRTHLALKLHSDFLRDKAGFLEQEVMRRAREIAALQDVSILALAALAETRDSDTGNHIRRTQLYVQTLAEKARPCARFAPVLEQTAYIHNLTRSAPLHDIGKVGIPDHILKKCGPLTHDEFEIMKTHAWLGFRALEQAERQVGQPLEFLGLAKEIAYGHHERWDGTGYPRGLGGDAIPLSARLMAIADVYDALICKRVYKNAMPHAQAVEIIAAGKGKHFDPELVELFQKNHRLFDDIAHSYAD